MDNLDANQLAALDQLRDLTNGGDDDVAIGVLSSVDWDVQRAADMIFGTGSSNPRPRIASPTPAAMEDFEVDDTEQSGLLPRAPAHPIQPFQRPSIILQLLAYPLHVLGSIFRFLFSVLRIPLPNLPFLSLNFYSRPSAARRPRSSAAGGPDRWIRELEEETGAVCIGRSATGASSGIAGPSRASARPSASSEHKYLPNFTTETYEQVLRRCQKEARVACIILVSEEHDDVAEFKRSTLTDPTFVNLLTDNEFIVYGGDVRSLDAYSASEKLNATTYPFVAFVSPQPARGSRASSSPGSVAVLSRHQGASNTTAETLCTHLTMNLIPRIFPYLMSRKQLETERTLRQEQDRAFEESKRKDTDRIRAKMAEEEQKKREEREREHLRLLEEQEQQRLVLQAEEDKQTRMWWRTWMRKCVVPPDAPGKGLRVAIRTPNGTRLLRTFVPERDTLTTLYAFVDSSTFIPDDFNPSSDPDISPIGVGPSELENVVQTHPDFWGFVLAATYPRKEVLWAPNTLLKDVDVLSGGAGQLVVEVKNGKTKPRGSLPSVKSDNSSDDGYETESDEE